jgi:hypothetical protein
LLLTDLLLRLAKENSSKKNGKIKERSLGHRLKGKID